MNKELISGWVSKNLGKANSQHSQELIDIINCCFDDIAPKLEWTLMADSQPQGKHDHVDCYIVLNCNKNDVFERPWNIHYQCFDDNEYDDFEYVPDEVFCWIEKPSVELPSPPSSVE